MKLNRIATYLSEPAIAGPLMYSRMLMRFGHTQDARQRLADLFKHAKSGASAGSAASLRRRERALGDAAALLADSYIVNSKRDDGVALFRQLLRASPGSGALYSGLLQLLFSGDHYLRLLKAIHVTLAPKLYLEIGVSTGASLACVLPSTEAAGVDPDPRLAFTVGPNITVFAETSDAFFAAYEARPQFTGRRADFAFIDGLHHFDQALRDFINVEKRMVNDGLIALHDCIPADELGAGRERKTDLWTGDVWKTLAILMDHRRDLDFTVVGAPPSGLVLVRNLAPASRTLEENFAALVQEYAGLRFADWERKYAPRIRMVPSRADEVARLLGRKTS